MSEKQKIGSEISILTLCTIHSLNIVEFRIAVSSKAGNQELVDFNFYWNHFPIQYVETILREHIFSHGFSGDLAEIIDCIVNVDYGGSSRFFRSYSLPGMEVN